MEGRNRVVFRINIYRALEPVLALGLKKFQERALNTPRKEGQVRKLLGSG